MTKSAHTISKRPSFTRAPRCSLRTTRRTQHIKQRRHGDDPDTSHAGVARRRRRLHPFAGAGGLISAHRTAQPQGEFSHDPQRHGRVGRRGVPDPTAHLRRPCADRTRVPVLCGFSVRVCAIDRTTARSHPHIARRFREPAGRTAAVRQTARPVHRPSGRGGLAGAVEGTLVASGGHRRLVDLTARRCGDRHRPCGPAYPHRAAPARRTASAGILRRRQRPLQHADTAARGTHNPRDARR